MLNELSTTFIAISTAVIVSHNTGFFLIKLYPFIFSYAPLVLDWPYHTPISGTIKVPNCIFFIGPVQDIEKAPHLRGAL